ncbi:MAG: aromatic ring-hydroxylating dioxygenase subunit alpha [Betaproteobacteria bacterium]|nr:aromatic ring-hydroxylating dioxygenase subunit alpha [Betaproteobacteria bacterium]
MTPTEHELLSQTGPGTAMGALLRRYWTAALLSRELPEPDGAPVRLRLLGEDLIAFRDTHGRVGLLDAHCSHRGAPLYFANNAEGGLRCWFHGWKYDVDGICIDMPNETPQNRFKDKVKHTAYPCVEKNGVVWTYMGPRDKMPRMPELEWLTVPASHVYVSKCIRHCHWTQGMEGDLDSVHVAFLHQEVFRKRAQAQNHESAKWLINDLTPKEEIVPTPAGCLHATYRDVDPQNRYWKIGQWFLPWFTTIPGFVGDGPLGGHAWVPIDDKRCWVFAFSWHPARPLTDGELSGKSAVAAFHAATIPGTADTVCNRGNDYAGPDAPPARQPWMRVTDVQAQDIAMTEGMGFLYDRAREHLGKSDRLIVLTRRRLIEAAQALRDGAEPPGMNAKDYRQRPISIVLPANVASWTDAVADAIDTRPETFRASV